jgi:microcin C transport system substrate-binding protein
MKKLLLLLLLLCSVLPVKAEELITSYGISNFGKVKLQKDFEHLPYVNPDAKKGGKITIGVYGNFDNLNPYILKGMVPSGLGMTMDSLFVGSGDELMSMYPLLAKNVQYPADLSYAIFEINENAKFDDNVKITTKDFKFSFDMIGENGAPFLQSFYKNVSSCEVISETKIKFNFKTKDTFEPLMAVASLSPLPVHFWQDKDFSKITLEVAPSSGAYSISKVDPGRSIVYKRNENYWANNLNVGVGQNNFDEIMFDYYKDEEVMFQAFLAGKIDFRQENKASRWVSGYDKLSDDYMKDEFDQNYPSGLQGIFFNTRRFSDINIRQGLEKLFNFEYIQANILSGQYIRSKNYFNGGGYSYQYKGNEEFTPSINSDKGITRENKKQALMLFKKAGYELKDQKLVNVKTNEQLKIEILLVAASMERVITPFVQDLKKFGIDASIRKVDSSQYVVRMDDFDFDATVVNFNFFVPPGPELLSYYSCAAANEKGSANYAGICDVKIDEHINKILTIKNDEEKLKELVRQLDEMLLTGFYVIPQWHNNKTWTAYNKKLKHPQVMPKYGIGFPNIWSTE